MQLVDQHRVSLDATKARKRRRAKPKKWTKGIKTKGLKAKPTVRSHVGLIPRDNGYNRVPASLVIGFFGNGLLRSRLSEALEPL